MEKKFILTFHISETELSQIGMMWYCNALVYQFKGNKLDQLRCETNLHLLESNMDKPQREHFKAAQKRVVQMADKYQTRRESTENGLCGHCGKAVPDDVPGCRIGDCPHK